MIDVGDEQRSGDTSRKPERTFADGRNIAADFAQTDR